MYLFFFSSRRRHTISYGDWSSDVCSSDLGGLIADQFRCFIRFNPFSVRDRTEKKYSFDVHDWMQIGSSRRSTNEQRAPYDNEINRFHRASLWPSLFDRQ